MSAVDPKIDVAYICRVALNFEEMDFEDLTCYFSSSVTSQAHKYTSEIQSQTNGDLFKWTVG